MSLKFEPSPAGKLLKKRCICFAELVEFSLKSDYNFHNMLFEERKNAMLDFEFYLPTRIWFGKNTLAKLAESIRNHGGTKLLLVYGKGSIKRTGLYDEVVSILKDNKLEFVELAGVDPNPRISTVRKGAELCRRNGLDFILAVGGGSVIDCSKCIAAAAVYDGDPWDFCTGRAWVQKALPLGTVLTIAATGSEMNDGGVITNEETKEKIGMGGDLLYPKFSILDPAYTFTVSREQTAAGVIDIMTHVYEFYFSRADSSYLQNRLSEAILQTCVKYGPVAYHSPEDYEARANLMWASSMALNGVICQGLVFDGFNHLTEHAVSAIYDITHGIGLSILVTHWMEYVLDGDTLHKFVEYAGNVWGIHGKDDRTAALEGIRRTRDFLRSIGLPTSFSEIGIDDSRFDEIIEKAFIWGDTLGQFKKLSKQDAANILKAAL